MPNTLHRLQFFLFLLLHIIISNYPTHSPLYWHGPDSSVGSLATGHLQSLGVCFTHDIMLIFLPPTKEEVNAFAHVCLSVCLSVSRITQKRVMDLDEMLYVDRCRDMEELINF